MSTNVSELERDYFGKVEQEKRRQLRERLDASAKDIAAQRKVADALETENLDAAARVHALGFTEDMAKVFDLMPLVHVAWADGSVHRKERAMILKLVESRGIARGTEAFIAMEALLEDQPSEAFMSESLHLLRDLLGGINDRSTTIVDLCIEVAATSGGFLGLGTRIGDDEKAKIASIVETFGSEATSSVQSSLTSDE